MMYIRQHNPLVVMLAITGVPTRRDIRNTMSAYSGIGIKQLLLYPRSGCELEYMSGEWFRVCSDIIETGHEMKFAIWLYDEFNWPSGTCGGKVPAFNPEFTCKALVICKKNGKIDIKRTSNGGYTDILNPDAVDYFIHLTHEQYASRFSGFFGTTVKGFFTDEPSQRYSCNPDMDHKDSVCIPYYTNLEGDYLKKTGRSLFKDIERSFDDKKQAMLWPVYFGLLGKRMREVYMKRLRNWCEKHNLLLTGHLMDEEPSYKAVFSNGDPLSVIRGFSLPGIDDIETKTTLDKAGWVMLGTAKYGINAVGNGGLAELFAIGPCDMPISKIRQMIWLAGLFGIDHYFLAVSQLDAYGNSKIPFFYSPIDRFQPWFDAWHHLAEEAEAAAEVAKKNDIISIQVRYPQTLSAEQAWHGGFRNHVREMELAELLRLLVRAQYPWEFIKEKDLPSLTACAVLSLTSSGITEEKSGIEFDGFNGLFDWLSSNASREAYVENPDGTMAGDLIVKPYDDGSAVVLDLTDGTGERSLVLKHRGKQTHFQLPGRGVVVAKQDFIKEIPPAEGMEIRVISFKMTLDRYNLMRCYFSNESTDFEFELDSKISDIRLLLRRHDGEAKILLDGSGMEAGLECCELPESYRRLYHSTNPFTLDGGRHVISLVSKTREYPYLPNVFLCGMFAVSQKRLLSPLPDYVNIGSLKYQGLLNYTGTIFLSAAVSVPERKDRVFLQLDTNGLYTGVSINGEFLGKRAWTPFVWEIPERYKGREVELMIEEATSQGGLFGDVSALVKEFAPDWMPHTEYEPGKYTDCGIITPPRWLFMERLTDENN